MQQFNLEEWLQNKSRKVVTRDGREVEILKTNRKDNVHPIIFTVLDQNNIEQVHFCNVNGICTTLQRPNKFDLFFADEVEELTEFEQELRYWIGQSLCNYENNGCVSDNMSDSANKYLKTASKKLLDLARKEIEKSIEDGAIEFAKSYMEDVNPSFKKVKESDELWKWKISCLRGINKAYKRGIQDVLKSLPKWKKATEHKEFDKHVCVMDYYMFPFLDTEVNEGDYYIELSDLKTLQKE